MSPGTSSEDVVIIGGGIAGTAAAYHLAQEGVSVRVIDRLGVADQQSGRNWGFIRSQGRDPNELPLAKLADMEWSSMREEIGDDLGLVKRGLLSVADSTVRMNEYRDWLGEAGDAANNTELVSADDVRRLAPSLRGDWLGGLYTSSDGHAEPKRATRAIASAAERAGAVFEIGTTVLQIDVRAGRAERLITTHGKRNAGTIVCAAGIWSSRLLRPLGIDLPTRWVRGTAASTTPVPSFSELAMWTPYVGFSQTPDGSVIFGTGAWTDYDLSLASLSHLRLFLPNYLRNRRAFRFHVGRHALEEATRRVPLGVRPRDPFRWPNVDEPPANAAKLRRSFNELRRLVPSLARARLLRRWAGYIDVTPDALPVLGRIPEIDGLVVATGMSSHGFGIGPAVGRVVAGAITGEDTGIDLQAFRSDRFLSARGVRTHKAI